MLGMTGNTINSLGPLADITLGPKLRLGPHILEAPLRRLPINSAVP